MTTARLLFDLQELDHRLSEASSRVSVIDESLGNREALKPREEEVGASREGLRSLEREQRNLEMTAESAREKTVAVESKLYGGSVVNPREIQDLDHEMTNLKKSLQKLDERMLELLMNLEQTQEELQDGEAHLKQEEEAWSQNQERMAQEKIQLQSELENLADQRQGIAKGLGQQELQLYERIRGSKGGQAVARVERGLCRSCGVTLPTHQVQRARAGRESVLCDSCGRILYVG